LNIKIGFGYDIHRLAKGRKLYLGGVAIPHPAGLAGHSDGDCLVHALIDSLLGAMGESDIGQLFPDSQPEYKGIRSTELLRRVMARLKRRKMNVLNIDIVIVAQAPRLAPYIKEMKKALRPFFSIPMANIGIKAKTNEGLGLIGREKAVGCWAVALVGKKEGKKA
jgi:2-C-methyl-D-erythritol 2,4-cyclodiphosphate synthase